MANGQKYTLTMVNNSPNDWDLCVFQKNPQNEISNYVSLAWFAKHCHPGTSVKFDWTIDYCFVWSEQGVLKRGINFTAFETRTTNLDENNQIRLAYNDGFYFMEPKNDVRKFLHIITDASVPLYKGSVGIGMSGSGTFVVPAEPNLHLRFSPHPSYWVAFGCYQPGDVMDYTETTNTQEVDYSPGIFDRTVTLNSNNTWVFSN